MPVSLVMIFANTVQQEGTIIYGGEGGILVHMCVCVCVCVCVGRGGLGLFDYVRLHVCAPALHFAKHPAGTSK